MVEPFTRNTPPSLPRGDARKKKNSPGRARRWTLTIGDGAPFAWEHGGRNRDGSPGPAEASGPGQVADWVLLLTDEAGVVTAYYMDVTATVTSLPKYGTLSADARSLGSGNAWDAWSASAATATGFAWRDGSGRDAALYDAGYESRMPLDVASFRPMGQCYGLDTSTYNGVASGTDGYRHCAANFGVGNAAVGRYRRQTGDAAVARRLRRHRVVYYHPNKGYAGVDAFEFTVRVGTRDSADDDASVVGTVGLHVRDCRKRTYDKETGAAAADAPLCACAADEANLFGNATACPAAVEAVCAAPATAPSFAPLCDACAGGAAVETTTCRRAIDRAATAVAGLGRCGDASGVADCRGEAATRDAPEPYVWWPDRHLVTPDRLRLTPVGARAANPGDGFRVVADA